MSFAQGQDWNVVSWSKTNTNGRLAGETKEEALNRARRTGAIATESKYNAATNKSAHSNLDVNMKKLEEDTENYKHQHVDKSLSKAIMQARLDKKMNQKALATAINEKPQIIAEYESGKAIPNNQIISKLEKALGTKLPRGQKKKTAAK